MNDYTELLELVEKNTMLFDELTEIQQVKLEGARDQDIARLEDCMKKEQAHTLALRGFDKKRLALQKNLSLEDKTFRELIPLVPEAYTASYQKAFDDLTQAYTRYQSTAECAKEMIEVNIYKMSTLINQIREKANLSGGDVYTPEGFVPASPKSRKDMKV